jgi:hypothetical protein
MATNMYGLENLARSQSEPYTSAIFFDNEQNNLVTVGSICPSINVVKVPESHRTSIYDPPYPTIKYDQSPLKEYIILNRFETNGYYRFCIAADQTDDTFDHISGLNYEHATILNNWIQSTAGSKKCVAIFDWDRTITLFEGVLGGSSKSSFEELFEKYDVTDDPNPVESALLYLCGGAGRLTMVRNMFQNCVNNNVDVIILTNNPTATGVPFQQLIKAIAPSSRVIISGSKALADDIRGNKGKVLERDAQFSTLCTNGIYYGGSRKRNLNRRYKVHRKTTKNRRKYKTIKNRKLNSKLKRRELKSRNRRR